MNSAESVALIFLIISAVKPFWGQLCKVQREVSSVLLSPQSFFGSTSIFPGRLGCSITQLVSDPNAIICNSKSILFDGDHGPKTFDLDERRTLNRFVGWPSESYMTFEFEVLTSVAAIDISVVHLPQRRVGLPDFQIYITSALDLIEVSNSTGLQAVLIPFDYLQNEYLSKIDHTVRTITLRLRVPEVVTRYLLLRWTFTGLAIEHFALSEIRFCADPQPKIIPQPILFQTPLEETTNILPSARDFRKNRPLILTCTVANPGSFTWQWVRNGQPISESDNVEIVGADGTRTTTLTILNPSSSDGNVAYFCHVSIDLQPSLGAARQFITLPLILINSGYIKDMPGIITCEAYGYIANINSEITWTFNGKSLSPEFHVRVMSGSEQLVSFNGRSRNSIISTLEIPDWRVDSLGFYECSISRSKLRPGTTLEPFSRISSSTTVRIATVKESDNITLMTSATPTSESVSLLPVMVNIASTFILLLVVAAMFLYTKRHRVSKLNRIEYFSKAEAVSGTSVSNSSLNVRNDSYPNL